MTLFSPYLWLIPEIIMIMIMLVHGIIIGVNPNKKKDQSMKNWEYPWMPIFLIVSWFLSLFAFLYLRDQFNLARRGEMLLAIIIFLYGVGVGPQGAFGELPENSKTLPHGYIVLLCLTAGVVLISYGFSIIHISRNVKVLESPAQTTIAPAAQAPAAAKGAPTSQFGKTRTFGKKKI